MFSRALLLYVGIALLLVGGLVSAVPTYAPRASGPPEFNGTLWYVGVPVALAGVGLLFWYNRARATPPPSD